MPEQFTPVTMTNGTGVALDADYFNRLEGAHELADNRATALEMGIRTPITLDYAATVAPDATQGAVFRCVATGDLTLAPTGGGEGQTIIVRIKASGGARSVSFEGGLVAPVLIASGGWWTCALTYDQADDAWILEY